MHFLLRYNNHAASRDLRRPAARSTVCARRNNGQEPRSHNLGLAVICSLVPVSLTTLLDVLKGGKQRLVKKQKQKRT